MARLQLEIPGEGDTRYLVNVRNIGDVADVMITEVSNRHDSVEAEEFECVGMPWPVLVGIVSEILRRWPGIDQEARR